MEDSPQSPKVTSLFDFKMARIRQEIEACSRMRQTVLDTVAKIEQDLAKNS